MSYIGSEVRQGKAVRTSFTASGGETSVNVTYTPGQLSVYLNGVKLVGGGDDYTSTNGTSITGLSPALSSGDIVEFIALDTFTAADMVPASTGGTFTGNVTHSGDLRSGNLKAADGTAAITIENSTGKVALKGGTDSEILAIHGRASDDFGIISFKENNSSTVKGQIKCDASDNMIFRTGPSTDNMTIDSAGNVTKPNQPSFLTRQTYNSHDSSAGPIRFADSPGGSVKHDTGSDLSVVNSNETRFTAPVAGRYLFTWNINMGNNSGGTETRYFSVSLRLNGATAIHSNMSMVAVTDGWGSGNSYDAHPGSAIVELSSGDYVSMYKSKSSSSDYNGSIHSDSTHFSGCLLG